MQKIFLELLKRPIAYHPIIAKALGSVNLAIMWCQLLYWSDKTKNKDGWIRKSREDIYKETALSRREQETARKIGKELGVIEEKRMGNPCTVNYRINLEKTSDIVNKFIDSEENETNNMKLPIIKEKQKVEKVEDKRDPLQKMIEDKNRHVHIIGIWARENNIPISNSEICQSFIRRNSRAAVLLKGYSDMEIIETIKVLKNTEYLKKFTLETVGKFIDSVSKSKKSEGPRIIGFEKVEKAGGVIAMRPIYEK